VDLWADFQLLKHGGLILSVCPKDPDIQWITRYLQQHSSNVSSGNQYIRQAEMGNTLASLENNPRQAIETLLAKDPRLISKQTTRQCKANLFSLEEWRPGRPITKTLVEEYAGSLQAEGKAPNTINQRLAVIRWYARKIADLAMVYQDDAELARHAARVATVRAVKGERPERGRHIEQGELSALIEAYTADTSPAGIHDAAIIALAWSTGLGRDEISPIELTDLTNQTEDSLDIGSLAKVKGSARFMSMTAHWLPSWIG
jgi:site-specific recombinase XerD